MKNHPGEPSLLWSPMSSPQKQQLNSPGFPETTPIPGTSTSAVSPSSYILGDTISFSRSCPHHVPPGYQVVSPAGDHPSPCSRCSYSERQNKHKKTRAALHRYPDQSLQPTAQEAEPANSLHDSQSPVAKCDQYLPGCLTATFTSNLVGPVTENKSNTHP